MTEVQEEVTKVLEELMKGFFATFGIKNLDEDLRREDALLVTEKLTGGKPHPTHYDNILKDWEEETGLRFRYIALTLNWLKSRGLDPSLNKNFADDDFSLIIKTWWPHCSKHHLPELADAYLKKTLAQDRGTS